MYIHIFKVLLSFPHNIKTSFQNFQLFGAALRDLNFLYIPTLFLQLDGVLKLDFSMQLIHEALRPSNYKTRFSYALKCL